MLTNKSTYATRCIWDFGNGITRETNQDTIHLRYEDYGNFNVTLSVSGITQKVIKCTKEIKVWENMSDRLINPGKPFLRSDTDRKNQTYGDLAGWTVTDNIKVFKDRTTKKMYGGFLKAYREPIDGKRCENLMFVFSKVGLDDAKLYQTVTLEKGSYRLYIRSLLMKGSNDCYFVAAKGNALPGRDELENPEVLGKKFFNTLPEADPEILLELTEKTTITFGLVVNTQTPPKGVTNEVVIESVGLAGFTK